MQTLENIQSLSECNFSSLDRLHTNGVIELDGAVFLTDFGILLLVRRRGHRFISCSPVGGAQFVLFWLALRAREATRGGKEVVIGRILAYRGLKSVKKIGEVGDIQNDPMSSSSSSSNTSASSATCAK